ncbi:hypothetical protein [Metabacillus niabensis]|uniref:hypothetical protein n=1 Tax=Metabacillus niabensis TaxID=324854 RepID=UPI001CF9EFB0|nr:hypothetical protein [Metabacillus niabensis]
MKKFCFSLLTAVFLFSSINLSSVFASTEEGVKAEEQLTPEQLQIQKELKELESSDSVDFELIPSEEVPESTEIINFDSVEEFEKYVQEINQEEQTFEETIQVNPTVPSLSKTTMSTMAAASTYNGDHVIKWWAPFSGFGMTGLACWKNIAFNYKYKFVSGKPQFTSVSNIKSYYTGLQIGVSWIQTTNGSASIIKKNTTNDTAKISVKGYSLLGFQVKGFSVGAKIGNTWTGSLTLK